MTRVDWWAGTTPAAGAKALEGEERRAQQQDAGGHPRDERQPCEAGDRAGRRRGVNQHMTAFLLSVLSTACCAGSMDR